MNLVNSLRHEWCWVVRVSVYRKVTPGQLFCFLPHSWHDEYYIVLVTLIYFKILHFSKPFLPVCLLIPSSFVADITLSTIRSLPGSPGMTVGTGRIRFCVWCWALMDCDGRVAEGKTSQVSRSTTDWIRISEDGRLSEYAERCKWSWLHLVTECNIF